MGSVEEGFSKKKLSLSKMAGKYLFSNVLTSSSGGRRCRRLFDRQTNKQTNKRV